MKSVRITRITSHPDHGTFGAVTVDDVPVCVTLEPYSRDNASMVSCIPAGKYLCKKHRSPSYGDTYIVTDVERRSAILFHWGNRDENTAGCILVGSSFGSLHGDWAVLSSKDAFTKFCSAVADESGEFMLTIKESY